MKVKDNLLLRRVADSWVVLAVGDGCADFNGMLTLNESGALLWNALREGRDPAAALRDAYGLSPAAAAADTRDFLDTLRSAGCLEE